MKTIHECFVLFWINPSSSILQSSNCVWHNYLACSSVHLFHGDYLVAPWNQTSCCFILQMHITVHEVRRQQSHKRKEKEWQTQDLKDCTSWQREWVWHSKTFLSLCSAHFLSIMKQECYIIKEWFFFYINHFSLIIFYHSVWLGFELFGLRVQVHSHGVQFYASAQRIWQSYRQEMGLKCGWCHAQKRWAENLRILKKRELKVDIGPCRQIVEFQLLGHRELNFLPLQQWLSFSDLYRQRWIEISNIMRWAVRALGIVSIVRIVSLSLCWKTKVRSW